jgi:hypothetical protein
MIRNRKNKLELYFIFSCLMMNIRNTVPHEQMSNLVLFHQCGASSIYVVFSSTYVVTNGFTRNRHIDLDA